MRTLNLFLFFIVQGSWLISFSQKKDDTRMIDNAGSTVESFENINYYKRNKIPFRDIIVFDRRFDSTKLGYANSNIRIQLGRSWTTILNEYFKRNLDSSSNKSLFIFIKSYWLQKGIVDKVIRKKVVLKDAFGADFLNIEDGGSCSVNLEVFARSDSNYFPLFRIDDSFFNQLNNFRKGNLSEFFFLPYDSVFQRLLVTDLTHLYQRKKITWQELTEHYEQRFNLPICKEPSPKKGIFLTFEDFKKNNPLLTEFRLKEGNKTDELYMGSGQNEQIVADYWGYFDGNSLYIKAGFNVFKAVRQQQTFEIYGAKYISNYHNNPVQGDLFKINSVGLDRKILQMNMDNGEFY
ncbi:MAG TPA: hypothetical protein VI461_03125 [Chitinophagaceae bacterium]|nr:hypothetical protein [Chitinophagaceae bacterium]